MHLHLFRQQANRTKARGVPCSPRAVGRRSGGRTYFGTEMLSPPTVITKSSRRFFA